MSDSGEDEPASTPAELETRAKNTAAMLSGTLNVQRQPLMPKLLKITANDAMATLKRAFKSPVVGAPDRSGAYGYGTGSKIPAAARRASELFLTAHLCIILTIFFTVQYGTKCPELQRRLASRKRFVPWGSKGTGVTFVPKLPVFAPVSVPEVQAELPPDIEPLVLWAPGEDAEPNAKPIMVDNMLLTWLRPHQRDSHLPTNAQVSADANPKRSFGQSKGSMQRKLVQLSGKTPQHKCI
eukprot:9036989-Pyramimonas_sp.AAC.2